MLKTLHVLLAAGSFAGLLARWVLLTGPARRAATRLGRALPHAVDALLLASGVVLASAGRWNPLTAPWLAVKLTLLVFYIVAGAAELRGPPRWQPAALVLAVAAFGAIVSVALTRSPLGMARGFA